MTHKEELKKCFDNIGVKYEEIEDHTIHVEGYGYGLFYTEFVFADDGTLIQYGSYE